VLGSLEDDYVWVHDYHLLVLPSLLRKRFHRIKCGIFLHSPFPSSELFRTFPRREEIIRSMLNAGGPWAVPARMGLGRRSPRLPSCARMSLAA
jgi:trehalose 6-phosphate synthase/phosphatase